jgi:hypothetical protein
MTDPPPVAGPASALVERALESYRTLAELGEQVEDEWQYVTDLTEAWSADLRQLAAADARPIDAATDDAVSAAMEEIGLIEDPHRAIDWLSTFPQIVRLALVSRP